MERADHFKDVSRRPILGVLVSLTLLLSTVFALGTADAANCTNTSTGRTPLNDLGTNSYQGFQGGLYPGGSNVDPESHDAQGTSLAEQITPRNSAGAPDPASGAVVFLSIGMSNTEQEFGRFMTLAKSDPGRHSSVSLVNGAQGGWAAPAVADPSSAYWEVVDRRLQQAGFTRAQVQAVWLKEALAEPNRAFPADATELQGDLERIVQILKQRFANLWLVYLSSRTYGGYASTLLNPEPYAYQSGFAVKWAIQDQIEGRLPVGAGSAPWLGWGPYLWADGQRPRSDGLTWSCTDFRSDDGTHPSDSGMDKVAHMLLDFVHSDGTARIWYEEGGTQPRGLLGILCELPILSALIC